ncbi:serine hydrolase domain-containing protein [Bernardetia sp. Wsw4-3y2]|uniref:serine hydrolase domain-containing protein n=1 Tax=Bernardetia sp. Wsw4-3y2 TaxID=3127471 RepID=UPI0030CCAA1D
MKFENVYKKVSFENNKLVLDGNSPLKLQMNISEIEDIIPQNGILLDGLSIEDEFKVDNFIRTYMEYYQVAGVSLALIDSGEVVFHNIYGYKNYSTKEPINKRTVFEGASTTKPMFTFAVMRLVERGIIDLDKPLYLYHEAPKDVQDDPNHKLITARMVLSHTTGFPNWAFMTPDGKLNIQFTPGTKFQYSGAGFEYLKDVVIKITGKDISTILKEEVLDVFEIKNTYFKYERGLEKIKADGHYGLTPTSMNIPEDVNTAASLHTDPQSYAKFLIGILNKKGLKKETYQEIFKIQTLTSEQETINKRTAEYFGLGLFFRDSPTFGKSFGHGGNNGDFKCDAMIYEKEGKGFVIMTNSDKGDAIFRNDLYKFLILGKEPVTP